MKIILPIILNPISRRKDKSVKLNMDTRELSPQEILTLMSIEGNECWLCLSPNENELEVPDEPAHVEEKTASERLRNVVFVWFKQETSSGKFIGTFESFKNQAYEKIIEGVKSKLI